MKKWNFCSPEVLEKLEKLKNHRISSQKNFQKSRKLFFVNCSVSTVMGLGWYLSVFWVGKHPTNHSESLSNDFQKHLNIDFSAWKFDFFQNSQKFITKTWFLRVFKSNRLFSYGCLGQTKLGEGQGGHKEKICRYDFHLKAYFLKKWNFCSPGVLEWIEEPKNPMLFELLEPFQDHMWIKISFFQKVSL